MFIITSKTRRTKNYIRGALKQGDYYGRAGETMEFGYAKMEEGGQLRGADALAAKKETEKQKILDENVRRGLIPSGKMTQKEYDEHNEIFCEEDGSVHTTADGKLPTHSWEVVGDAPEEVTEIPNDGHKNNP